MTEKPDPRIHPYRPDIAADYLKGHVKARKYKAGEQRRCITATTPIFKSADLKAMPVSELLFGEDFIVYEEKKGWCWGQCVTDGYVGYVRSKPLVTDNATITHRVSAFLSLVYDQPDFKIAPSLSLSMGSLLAVDHTKPARNGFVPLQHGGWIYEKHIVSVNSAHHDYIETALSLIGVPYLWGGRSTKGIDCSGLVQRVLCEAGMMAPRDSDMQEKHMQAGALLSLNDLRKRGDLVFFPGHVGLMMDDTYLIHANATNMVVSVEPADEVAKWTYQQSGQGITAIRRLPYQQNQPTIPQNRKGGCQSTPTPPS